MIYRTLPPGGLDAWADHCAEVFGEPAAYFHRHFTQDPHADAGLIFVAMDGGVIASAVRVFVRTIWLQGRAVSMGGIGEVSTKPAYRRQGHAGALLHMAVEAMVARGMQVSILFGNQPLYIQAGWRFCAAARTRIQTDCLPVLLNGYETRPFQADDLPFAMGAYDLYAGRMDGAVLRGEAYWRQWVLPQWKGPWVLACEGAPMAYTCCEAAPNGTLYIAELMAAPQGERAIPAFLGTLARQTSCAQVNVAAPLLPGEAMGEDASLPQGMMVRLNIPMEGIGDSDALAAAFCHGGMCGIDAF